MMTIHSGTLLDQLRWLLQDESCRGQTDAELLECFVTRRDANAFGTLMKRHAAMVWGVCRHLLHREQDAEDAFQATFLVLARRAYCIRKAESVGSWLHSVAYRTAMKARKNAQKRQTLEREAPARESAAPSDLAWCELQALLDEEVQCLPEKYRAPFVICCLGSKSRDEAAHELSVNGNTISSRIARARQLLQERLTRRGVTLSAALCAASLWQQSAAAVVPAMLLRNVIAVVSGTGSVSVAVSALVGQTARALALARWPVHMIMLMAIGVFTGSAGVYGFAFLKECAVAMPDDADVVPTARTDVHGDPLPRGVVARLGTARQRAADSQVAVSMDGKEIITLSHDLVLRRFDAENGDIKSVRRLSGARPTKVWLSPYGSYAALCKYDLREGYRVELWDLDRAECRATLPIKNYSPWNVAFSGDGRRVAVIGTSSNQRKHQVRIWDWPTSRSRDIWSFEEQINSYYLTPVVALSPDGKYVVACHLDRELRAWEAENGKLLWDGKERNWSKIILISPDGRTVATGSGVNCGLALYDLVTGEPRKLMHPLPKNELIYPIGFSPDGQSIVFESGYEEIMLWEPETGRVSLQLPRPLARRSSNTMITPAGLPTNFAFTPDGKGFVRLAGALQRWDVTTSKACFPDTEAWGHTDEVTRLIFAPDGKYLASTSRDRTVRCWEISTAQTKQVIPKGLSSHLAFLPDGRHLLIVPNELGNTVLRSWDVTNGKPGQDFNLADRKEFMTGDRDRELHVTSDGKKIFMLTWKNGKQGDESVLSVWDAASGACLQHKRVPWGEQSVFTPDGTGVLALDSRSEAFQLLDVESETVQRMFATGAIRDPKKQAYGGNLALSPDGRLFAGRIQYLSRGSGSMDYDMLRISDVSTGHRVMEFSLEGPAVFTFSADNRLFAVAGSNSIRLWETASWKEIGRLSTEHPELLAAEKSFATALAFGPDGRTLATGHEDCTIQLWDATLRSSSRGGRLTVSECTALWDDLAAADAARAYAAVWKLADDPQRILPLMQEKLSPIVSAAPELIEALFKELEHNDYQVRQKATQKLRDLGDAATPSLRQALKAKLSLEQRRRIEALLETEKTPRPLTNEELRAVRAVHVLEQIGSSEAQALLDRLAQGADSARLTQAAQAAIARYKGKSTTGMP